MTTSKHTEIQENEYINIHNNFLNGKIAVKQLLADNSTCLINSNLSHIIE